MPTLTTTIHIGLPLIAMGMVTIHPITPEDLIPAVGIPQVHMIAIITQGITVTDITTITDIKA